MGIIMPSADQIYQLAGRVEVMKPASISDKNAKHKEKLQEMLMSPDVAAETKIDGCHYTMFGCYFLSKDHNDKTENFPHLRAGFVDMGMPNLILDGEIYYPGKTSQYCVRVTGAKPENAIQFQQDNSYIHFKIFDILRLPNGQWITNLPYAQRRKLLETFLRDYVSINTKLAPYVSITDMVVDNKKEFLDNILAGGGEGVVLKRLDSIYAFGKKPMWQWMKVKQHDSTDMIITGTKPAKVLYAGPNIENWKYWMHIDGMDRPVTKAHYNNWIGAFQLSSYVNGVLKVVCYAAGLSEELLEDFSINPDKYMNKVARIDFMERTEDGYPRHPSYKGLHEDKQPHECTYSLTGEDE